MESKKWYGLTISKKAAKISSKGKSVFESDSDDNMEDRVKIKKESSSSTKEKKKRAPDSKPDEIDPNIYEYDSIYDEMKASQQQKTSHSKSKEPRYINLLLKAADKRKKESERRVERKIQAERVKEGNAFKDKEAFVTSAYRQKMIEMEEEEERERRESALEEMMDSTKQKDLSGFYRHFLKQTVGEEKVPEFGERDAKIISAAKMKQDYSEAGGSKQRSESPAEPRAGQRHSLSDDSDAHSDIRLETEKSYKHESFKSESKHGAHSEPVKSGHLRDKTLSYKNKSRHRSSSLSDSEGRKGKHREKGHKKKSDHSTHGSKPVRDGKTKNSRSSRDQEDKLHDRDKPGHSKNTVKQISPSEKCRDNQPPKKSVDSHSQRSKLDKDGKEYKKDVRTRSKTEKESPQTDAKSTSDEKNYDSDKRSSSSKSRVSKAIKHYDSPSKKREGRGSSDSYSENKRRKYDNDKDDTSSSSSVDDEVTTEDNQKGESKESPEKRKTDMITKFAKRTVGKIFDDAQARYFKRREAAEAMH